MSAPDPDRWRGLYPKYRLYRIHGDKLTQVHDPFFALRYTTDPHARVALAAYADSCEAEYAHVAADLRTQLAHTEDASDQDHLPLNKIHG